MLTASAILLTVYILPKVDAKASRSMPHLVAALIVTTLLWCVGAKMNASSMGKLMSNGSWLFHVGGLRSSLPSKR